MTLFEMAVFPSPRYVVGSEGWSNPRVAAILDARGRSPMCDQVARPLLDRGAGGRSPGFLNFFNKCIWPNKSGCVKSLFSGADVGPQAIGCTWRSGVSCPFQTAPT